MEAAIQITTFIVMIGVAWVLKIIVNWAFASGGFIGLALAFAAVSGFLLFVVFYFDLEV